MRIARWIFLGTIISALMFGAIQGALLNRGLSELREQQELQSEQLAGLSKDLSAENPLAVSRRLIQIDVGNYPDYYIVSAVRAFNGDILVFCKCGDSHATPPPNSIVLFRSSDGGNTWSSQVVVEGDATTSYMNPIAGVTETNRILLMYGRYRDGTYKGCMRYSDDHGVSWSNELYILDIGITARDNVGSVGNIIINPTNHDILYAQYDESPFHSAFLFKSTKAENGLNWTLVGTIATHATYQFFEPCLAYVDERLFCGLRVGLGGVEQVFGFVYSDDHGLTWSDLHLVEEMGGTQWTYIAAPWGLALAVRGHGYTASHSKNWYDTTMFFTSQDGKFWFPSEFQYLTSPTKLRGGGYCSSVTLPNGDTMLFQAIGSAAYGTSTVPICEFAGLYALVLTPSDFQPGRNSKAGYRILSLPTLSSSNYEESEEVDLNEVSSLNLTVECTYHTDASVGAKLYLYASTDGLNWDTEPVEAAQRARFLKCVLENLADCPISNVKITATLGA